MDEIVKYLKALVILQLNRQADGTIAKPELMLHLAGIKNKEIAEMLGKKEAAVAKSISRAKPGAKEAQS